MKILILKIRVFKNTINLIIVIAFFITCIHTLIKESERD